MDNNKKDLSLKHCRYYKGEEINPFNDYRIPFWQLEKIWLDMVGNDSKILSEYCEEFKIACPSLANDDIIPMSLKAIIHNRYCHFGGSDEGFKDFFKKHYQ